MSKNKEVDTFYRVIEEVEKRIARWPAWQREILTRGAQDERCSKCGRSNKTSKRAKRHR